ncbi:hypothetical protein LCGC14_0811660 [marine sediment metagenome]|uniref:Uncharacterized protein n=1 Tax=marine sediment metagenome TaxID=412755 RepID=A0A0F9STV7_9ZZZZ
MAICICKDPRRLKRISEWIRCPLQGGGHTKFLINECSGCDGIVFFPDDNYKLAMDKGTDYTKKLLNEIIKEGKSVI